MSMVIQQQINLFQSGLLQKRDPMSARRAAATVLAVLLVLAVISGVFQWRLNRLNRRLEAERQRVTQTETNLAKMGALMAPQKKSHLLEEAIKNLNTETAAKQHLLDRLATRIAGDNSGFSDYLEALGRRHVSGLWLREISFGGGEVTLAGSARRPDQVPRYLQQLGKEKVFRGLDFNQFRLGRSDGGNLDFLLKTVPEDKP
jgi:Tfp pilus assembly protein PilN